MAIWKIISAFIVSFLCGHLLKELYPIVMDVAFAIILLVGWVGLLVIAVEGVSSRKRGNKK